MVAPEEWGLVAVGRVREVRDCGEKAEEGVEEVVEAG